MNIKDEDLKEKFLSVCVINDNCVCFGCEEPMFRNCKVHICRDKDCDQPRDDVLICTKCFNFIRLLNGKIIHQSLFVNSQDRCSCNHLEIFFVDGRKYQAVYIKDVENLKYGFNC
jgi:hypothetical protein